ncbi:unnamed protein product [Camellia sinensis]
MLGWQYFGFLFFFLIVFTFLSLPFLSFPFFVFPSDKERKKGRGRDCLCGMLLCLCCYMLQVVDAPEILTVIGKIPHLLGFLNSLYDCQYKSFFSAFAGLMEQIKLDRYLHPHFRYT